jgi:hypothetical protein
MFPETPLLAEGRYFQYRIVLPRGESATAVPTISNLKMSLIDSRVPWFLALADKLQPSLSTSAGQGPRIVTRAQWRSPDPYGRRFQGSRRFWNPQYAAVRQIFLHHTVIYGKASNPAAAVRAIWSYHTYTRGWGDIGYNYLIDQKGTIYEGRFGGDNVVAGHVLSYNRGSLGVALLGCFEPRNAACKGSPPPSAAMRSSLINLISWKAVNYEINPNIVRRFCGVKSCVRLWTIAGHRDARPTACPGTTVYNQLKSIRRQVASRMSVWQFSAKQLDFSQVIIGGDGAEKTVTIRFKNTGRVSWSKTVNRLRLKTANPPNRISAFQGSGWLDAQTPAELSEDNVAPGEIGTFTLNLKASAIGVGEYYESFQLAAEGQTEIPQIFTITVRVQAPVITSELIDSPDSPSL